MVAASNGFHRRIPLTIVGGFLGSGKTTLLNHIINNANGRRFAVVVNDFGDINIDARLVVSVEGETIALTNGCICCVIRDDLVDEVLKLCRRDDPPEHIIIESSGVAKPVAVVESFFRPEVLQFVDVQTIITLLDADQVIGEAATYADLAYAQIAVADLVVINKTDLVEPGRLGDVRAKVESIVPRARILETTFGAIPMNLLFDHDISAAAAARLATPDDGERQQHHHHHHHADGHRDQFTAWSYRNDDKAFSFDAIQRVVEHLPRGIFRAKGIIRLDLPTNDYGVLQVTGRRGWLKLTACDGSGGADVTTELVFIGKPGTTSREELRDHIERAWHSANSPEASGYVVTDLRAFSVQFV